jgi:hypothetical protein
LAKVCPTHDNFLNKIYVFEIFELIFFKVSSQKVLEIGNMPIDGGLKMAMTIKLSSQAHN